MNEIIELQLPDKTIVFNESQLKVFNALFNENGTLKQDCPREVAFFGAVRCGKSYLYQLIGFLLANRYDKCRILWVRDTYGQLKDSVIKQFNDDFGRYSAFEYKKTEREAVFPNGSTIKFRAFDIDGLGILSSEYDMIVFCQAEDVFEQWFMLALSRLSGNVLPKPIMLCEGNPANTWVKKRYKDATREELLSKDILFVEAGTLENAKNLPVNYIEMLRANYSPQFFNRYVMGGWEQIDEMVFDSFRQNEHVIDPVDTKYIVNFKQRSGLDYGWVNPTAIVWGYIDFDGCLTIFDEWGGSKQTPKEIALQANRYGKMVIVADYSIKRPDRDGRSVWLDLCDAGLNLLESNKQELANIQLANTLFKTGRLKISRSCVNLITEIKDYKFKRLKLGQEQTHNTPEETVDKNNHYIDALLYLIASLEELKSHDPKLLKEKESLKAKTFEMPEYDFSQRG